jgi:predicted dehydrogenase/aryl-alcohol dehydrogenase-like predicted oxidoreductase
MEKKLKWGILSTGAIARTFARGLAHSETGILIAVGSRSQENADSFAREFRIDRAYGSYQKLLADKDVEAVYIATPHPYHAEWAIKAAEAKKHILCEKPIGINHAEAMAIIEAARANDVFLMEAFMYRCHPQTAKLVELVREKAIGDIKLIQAAFSFDAGENLDSRLLNNSLGGGGILDVGCYCTSISRLIAGVASGGETMEPVEVKGCGHIGEKSRVDEWAVASLRFPEDIVAQLVTGVRLSMENDVKIYGSKGWILVRSPWVPSREGGKTTIVVYLWGKEKPHEIEIETGRWLYAIEADTVATSINNRQASFPAMTWNDTLGNMQTLDRWRESIGMIYDSEKPEAKRPPVSGRPLSVKANSSMKYGKIPGILPGISRLVMGVDNQTTMPHASVMFDDFIERGGTCFDTAYVYGGGLCETLLGWWVKNRNIRRNIVILDKGAHTPFCTPEHLTKQLIASLDRLQTDYIDLYMLHRDNPEVPVGEFIDVLNEHVDAGRISAFGCSNWTIKRIEQANRYALSRGKRPFAAVSNNFSLARMVEPVWEGVIAASDCESREWFKKTKIPLFAWSSQARGFFTDRVKRDDPASRRDARPWYSEDNFRRKERAEQLARKYRVLPIQIALAYVLCQPFPVFALIGPRTLEETRISFGALEIKLSPEELAFLDLQV